MLMTGGWFMDVYGVVLPTLSKFFLKEINDLKMMK